MYIVAVLDRLSPTSDGNATYTDVANGIIEVETALANVSIQCISYDKYYSRPANRARKLVGMNIV